MDITKIIKSIKKEQPEIESVFFVGCGASKAELYPAKYLLENKTKRFKVYHYTSNEFVYAAPELLNEKSIVIACSLFGTTPETVEAAKKAKAIGAKVIAVTYASESPLAQNNNYLVVHGWAEKTSGKLEKMGTVLKLAFEILHVFEDYADYDKAMEGFEKIYDIIDRSVEAVGPSAQKFAETYKDEKMFYVMGSGPSMEVAYAFSICLLMEMQWINSASVHTGEYFHGPFEITDKQRPFILLMNEGRTRALDKRALDFLNRFGEKITILDTKDFGLGSEIDSSVVEYFDPMLLTALLREHAERLAVVRKHPLTKRRYMWKLEY